MKIGNGKKEMDNLRERDYNDEINTIEIYEKYKFHWKWFVLCLIVSVLAAFFFMLAVQDEYEVSSTIFIDDKETGGMSTEISAFKDFNLSEKPSITNEIEVLKSRSLIEKTIEALEINISYFLEDNFLEYEIHKTESPVYFQMLEKHESLFNMDTSFSIKRRTESKFELINDDGNSVGTFSFGERITRPFGSFSVVLNGESIMEIGKSVLIRIEPLKAVAFKYRKRIEISSLGKKSSLIELTLRDVVKQKAIDILDNLIINYNMNAIEYKRHVTRNTDQFINDRIEDISVELTTVDKGVEEFKIKNKLTDLDRESSLNLESDSELENKIVELNSNIRLVDFVIDYMGSNPGELIPDNMQVIDAANAENIKNYNNLLIEKNRIIKNSSKLNPAVINLESQIMSLGEVIEQSLNSLRSSLIFSLSEAKSQEYRLDSKKVLAPKQERLFKDIKRRQQIIESLYLYLLEKREENAIALGIPVPNAKIIDKADGDFRPVFPKPIVIFSISIILGLFVPLFVIGVHSIFDNTVHSVDDVTNVIHAPIIGDIPKIKSDLTVIKSGQKNSSFHESFRLLRTNLNFMLSHDTNTAKRIFVTSTIGSEGKSTISINLASILSLSDKKVLLIEADLRKPKIYKYLNINTKQGLTNYLAGIESRIDKLLITSKELNIDIIGAGEIAPNPSELFLNGRFKNLLDEVSQNYDYIIVDTPPISVVTDTLLLGEYADLFIYVVRANYLDKRLLKKAQDIVENNRLPNTAIVVNGTDFKKVGIGGSYGYYD